MNALLHKSHCLVRGFEFIELGECSVPAACNFPGIAKPPGIEPVLLLPSGSLNPSGSKPYTAKLADCLASLTKSPNPGEQTGGEASKDFRESVLVSPVTVDGTLRSNNEADGGPVATDLHNPSGIRGFSNQEKFIGNNVFGMSGKLTRSLLLLLWLLFDIRGGIFSGLCVLIPVVIVAVADGVAVVLLFGVVTNFAV